ncbi:MAG: DUF814 domain-containing protein [Bacteroidetes bacterium]|nr:DUF814 domain-containing protein [Bacteroidota bacterium]
MFDNYFFLCRLTKELDIALRGYSLVDTFSQNRNEIVLEFQKHSSSKFLVFSFASLPPLIDLRENFGKARKNVIQFFVDIYNTSLSTASIDLYERNIRLIFDNFHIVILIRGNQSNCVLISDLGAIKASFKKKSELVNKIFNLIYPTSQVDETIFTNKAKFDQCLASYVRGEKNIYHQILGSQIIEEIIARHSKNSGVTYFDSFQNIIEEMKNENVLEYDDGTFSVGKFFSKGKVIQEHSQFFEPVRKIYYSKGSINKAEKLKERLIKNVSQQIEKLDKKLIQLRLERNLTDQSSHYRIKGNLILQHMGDLQKGAKKVILKDEEGDPISISLDPSKSFHENASIYFSKAKEEKNRLEAVLTQIKSTEKELNKTKNLFDKIKSTDDHQSLIKFEKELSSKQQQPKSPDEIETKFRHFTVFGDYDVYVGKESKSNDLLTTKYARPHDLWFHVRGASGSHTILRRKEKKKDFPKEAILEAASIAAFYSKAKHSKYVPVAYAEKKYVTKKKNLPSGTVFLQREKVVMVEPKLTNRISEEV